MMSSCKVYHGNRTIQKSKYRELTVLFFETLKGNATVKPRKAEKDRYNGETKRTIKIEHIDHI